MRGKVEVSAPYSKMKHELVNVLVNEGYIKGCEKVEEDNNKASINIVLKYFNSQPAIKDLKRISKPSLRRYAGPEDLKPVKNGLGMYIISTNQGLMTDKEAKAKNIGGEVLCEVF
jgi:small subunit ribosomal protein S8